MPTTITTAMTTTTIFLQQQQHPQQQDERSHSGRRCIVDHSNDMETKKNIQKETENGNT